MLVSFYENNFHLIPCGSKTDVIPDYFKTRHPYEDDDVLVKRWAKTPRVKWADYIQKQAHLKEIKQWYLQFPNCNWAAVTGINFVVLMQTHKKPVTFVNQDRSQEQRSNKKHQEVAIIISMPSILN